MSRTISETLQSKPILHPQECTGDYLFEGVKILATKAFMETFKDESYALLLASQKLILETYDNPDYLQVFSYNNIKYFCMSGFSKGNKASDYEGIDELYITFMLPEDY